MTVYNTRKRISEEDSEAPIQNIEFNNDVEGTATIRELDLYENDSNNNTTIREELLEFPIADETQAGFMSPTSYQDIENLKVEIETLFSFKISQPYDKLDDITDPQEKIIYMVKNNESYDLYLWFRNKENHFQKIGNTSLDMSEYLTTKDGLSLHEAIQRRELLSNKKDNFDDANDTTYPTTLATKTELDKKEVWGNKKTDFDDANHTTYPTTLATKTELNKKEILDKKINSWNDINYDATKDIKEATYPTSYLVKSSLDEKELRDNKKTTFENANDTTYPTTLATKTELNKKEILDKKINSWNDINYNATEDIKEATYPTSYLVKSSLDTLQEQSVEIFIGDSKPSIESSNFKLWINDSDGGDVFEVVDNLEYDTSTTGKSLSAHQGYVLNNNKADKTQLNDYTKTVDLDSLIATYGYLKTHQSLEDYYIKSEVNSLLDNKQDTLVSGSNVKTINNESILGSGNITIQGGGGGTGVLPQFTYTDLQTIIDDANDGDTIYLTGYFKYDNSIDTIENITFNKSLNLIGKNCVIDGNSQDCFYFSLGGKTISIENCNFINCNIAFYGYRTTSFSIDSCIFQNCEKAIHIDAYTHYSITNCIFNNNNQAIYLNNFQTEGNVVDCIFKTATDTVVGITPTYTSLNNKKDGEIVTKDNLKNKSTLTFVLSDGTTETHTFYEEV